jgi:hypothetical protein
MHANDEKISSFVKNVAPYQPSRGIASVHLVMIAQSEKEICFRCALDGRRTVHRAASASSLGFSRVIAL